MWKPPAADLESVQPTVLVGHEWLESDCSNSDSRKRQSTSASLEAKASFSLCFQRTPLVMLHLLPQRLLRMSKTIHISSLFPISPPYPPDTLLPDPSPPPPALLPWPPTSVRPLRPSSSPVAFWASTSACCCLVSAPFCWLCCCSAESTTGVLFSSEPSWPDDLAVGGTSGADASYLCAER